MDRRKAVVFSIVLLAALVAVAANYLSFFALGQWAVNNSSCEKTNLAAGLYRAGESGLKDLARQMQAGVKADAKDEDPFDVSVRAEGRTLIYTFKTKRPIVDMAAFHRYVSQRQKKLFEDRCSDDDEFMISVKAIETHTYYSVEGERLTSFSIDRSDCPQW